MLNSKAECCDSGYIMQIQNYSVNDGDGIRTNIFLSGCPLRCPWCSNPEGQTVENPMTRRVGADEIIKEVERQSLFHMFSGGGVTFTGGEATVQEGFLRCLSRRLYDMGTDLAIETCGAFDFERVRDILSLMDTVFIDIKHMDSEVHESLTHYKLEPVLENICNIDNLFHPGSNSSCLDNKKPEKRLIVRIPLIVCVNSDEENLKKTFEFMCTNLIEPAIEFLPYHKYGEEKYRQLGMKVPDSCFETPTDEAVRNAGSLAESYGIKVVSYK